jgi:hypothetical protein
MATSSNSTPPEAPDNRPSLPSDREARAPVRIGARSSTSDRSNSKTITIAVAVHVVAFVAFLRLVSLGHGFYDWFGLTGPYEKLEEQVTYVETPKPKVVKPAPKPVEKPKPAEKPQVSTGPVVGTPTPVAPIVPQVNVGTGGIGVDSGSAPPRRGGINPLLVGIAPANADPRIWIPGPAGINVPRSRQEQLDSVVAYAITSAADSLDSIARIYAPGKPAGDWTKRMKNGEKWGWDKTGLRLGKVTVPNALLALLPAGVQQRMSGNPLAMASAARLALSRSDIDRFERVSMNEADFRKEIKELRVKKEREHQEKSKARAAERAASALTPPP